MVRFERGQSLIFVPQAVRYKLQVGGMLVKVASIGTPDGGQAQPLNCLAVRACCPEPVTMISICHWPSHHLAGQEGAARTAM